MTVLYPSASLPLVGRYMASFSESSHWLPSIPPGMIGVSIPAFGILIRCGVVGSIMASAL
jgi:hypothetical protein